MDGGGRYSGSLNAAGQAGVDGTPAPGPGSLVAGLAARLPRLVRPMALGITAEAQTAAAVLGHNFPDSPWYKDAFALLQNGGLEPREEKSSWLSKVYRGVIGRTADAR